MLSVSFALLIISLLSLCFEEETKNKKNTGIQTEREREREIERFILYFIFYYINPAKYVFHLGVMQANRHR